MGIVVPTSLAIGDDVEYLLNSVRPMLALNIGGMGAPGQNFYNDLACRYGYQAAAARIQQLYLSGQRREAEAAVPVELVCSISLIAPAGFVRDRAEALAATGVTTLAVHSLGQTHADRVRGIERLADALTLPALHADG
jgi:hypothetical protein